MSIWDDPDAYTDWAETNTPTQRKKNIIYKKGETIRTYKHRVLHIHFPQTEEQWQKATHARRSKAAKLAAKNRPSISRGIYADPWGLTPAQRRQTGYYQQQMRVKESKSIGIEDMRALLKDDHWEEVCGHTRWKYDRNSTIKEFKKYQMSHRGMY